jgi:hypothetical protein
MKKKFYKAQLGILNYGIRIDSGSVGNSSDFFSALNTDVQYRPIVFPPMDAQKRNDNIVMKLTNINPMNERIKFIDCKKLK